MRSKSLIAAHSEETLRFSLLNMVGGFCKFQSTVLWPNVLTLAQDNLRIQLPRVAVENIVSTQFLTQKRTTILISFSAAHAATRPICETISSLVEVSV